MQRPGIAPAYIFSLGRDAQTALVHCTGIIS
jgi:hypothetical protein